MSVVTEETIVRAILNKEQVALDYVLDKYGNLVKSIINKHMRQLQMYHEECFNDVLLAIWDNAQKYDIEKSSLKNWIAGIARYKAISYARKYMHESTWEDVDAAYDIEDEKARLSLLESEHNAAFEALIEPLSEQDRELFRRLYFHEQGVEEISNDMEISGSVIYNRVSRAKKKLRLLLGGKDEKGHL